jgi:uncharacterized protein (UPF0332 family)
MRALTTARELQVRDPDGSVNRSHYAMFDIARAALLSTGLPDDELPRTRSGVVAAFSKCAVQSGIIEQKLSGALGRTESLRLMADYTGTPLDAKTAGHSNQPDGVSEPGDATREAHDQTLKPLSIAEMQRQARENWLKLRQEIIETAKGASPSAARDLQQDRSHSIDDDPDP